MKTHRILLLLMLLANTLCANILRVNNTAGYAAGYTTLGAAVAAANTGDTIYVEPSPNAYDAGATLTIAKKVVVVGNGYHLDVNTNLQVKNHDSGIAPAVLLAPGSEGAVLTGLRFLGGVGIEADNITLKRCTGAVYVGFSPNTGGVAITAQTQILESFITGLYADGGNSNNTALLIRNNIIIGSALFSAGDAGIFENNTVTGSCDFGNAQFNVVNNLVLNGMFNFGNIAAGHNTCSCTGDFPAGSNNETGATWNDLFLGGAPFDRDQFYRLNTNGLAADNGFYGNGDDRGAFNDAPGRTSYRLGGIPEFPAIYKLQGGGTVTGPTIQVILSARSNN